MKVKFRVTAVAIIFAISICASFWVQAQLPEEVTRESYLAIKLARKTINKSVLVLNETDQVSFETSTPRKINFRLISPAGAIIHESLIKKRKEPWKFNVVESGNYSVEIENVSFLLNCKVNQKISLNRYPFHIGAPKDSIPFTVQIDRDQSIEAEGKFQINRFNDKKLTIGPLEKGDTVLLNLTPINKKSPILKIKNGAGELLFASRKSKKDIIASIPVLNVDSFDITMVSESWLGQENTFRIDKVSPMKNIIDKDLIPKPIRLDTIPIDYLDTTIYLGAVRDYVNSNYEVFYFNFKEDTTIAFWSLVFGVGKEFEQTMAVLAEELQAAEAVEEMTYADVLQNYVLGNPEELAFNEDQKLITSKTEQGQNISIEPQKIENKPDPVNKRVVLSNVIVSASTEIAASIQSKSGVNFALLDNLCCNHFIKFENLDKSVGRKVYVKVLLFKINTITDL
ncbi:MAG: hypothetical protein HQ474_06530 [Flammeovirgaceae bacterium]|nr:hypothetical protein [Flammeovirgaceae bacterium]